MEQELEQELEIHQQKEVEQELAIHQQKEVEQELEVHQKELPQEKDIHQKKEILRNQIQDIQDQIRGIHPSQISCWIHQNQNCQNDCGLGFVRIYHYHILYLPFCSYNL